MELLKAVVEDAAAQVDHHLRVEVLGSYRRGAKSSGDVDCLITHPRYSDNRPPWLTASSFERVDYAEKIQHHNCKP